MNPFSSILITGASSGIGHALARELSQDNVTIALLGRNQKKLLELAKACEEKGAKAFPIVADVTDAEQMKKELLNFDDRHPIDLLIANAGIGTGQSRQKNGGKENQCEVIETNILGVQFTIEPLVERFKQRQKGHIALMSSLASYRGFSQYYVYNATKAYVRVYGEGLQLDLKRYHVAVSTIAPGFIKTPLTDANTFKMPLIMSPEKAAKIILKGLLNKKPLIAFPKIIHLFLKMMAALPTSIANFIAAKIG